MGCLSEEKRRSMDIQRSENQLNDYVKSVIQKVQQPLYLNEAFIDDIVVLYENDIEAQAAADRIDSRICQMLAAAP